MNYCRRTHVELEQLLVAQEVFKVGLDYEKWKTYIYIYILLVSQVH